MKQRYAFLILGTLICANPTPTWAQAPPKPGPEHKKLDYFAGKWTIEGETKPSPFGPAGKMSGSETCAWFEGGFNLICNSTSTGPGGKVTGQTTLGWSGEGKHYTFFGIDSSGWSDAAKGQAEGDTFNWASEGTMGGKPFKVRYTVKQTPPDAYTFKGEVSIGGAPLVTFVEGKETRAK